MGDAGSRCEVSGEWSARRRIGLLLRDRAGAAATAKYLVHSSGVLLPRARRSIWVHGEAPAQFDVARRLIQEVMRERPHVRLVLTSVFPATIEYLRRSFPDDYAGPAPWDARFSVRRFFARLNPRLVLLLDGGRSFGAGALAETLAAGVPIGVVDVGRVDDLDRAVLSAAVSGAGNIRFCFRAEQDAECARAAGIRPEAIATTGSMHLDPDHPLRLPDADALRRMVGVSADTLLVVASSVPHSEEKLVLDAFAEARPARLEIRLVIEPSYRARGAALLAEIRRRGLVGWRRASPSAKAPSERWHVAVAEVPGELAALFPVARVALLGGTFSEGAFSRGAAEGYLNAALAARCPMLIGSNSCVDLPPTIGRDGAHLRVEAGSLAIALRSEIERDRGGVFPPLEPVASTAARRTAEALRDVLPDSPGVPPVRHARRVATLRGRGGQSRVWKKMAPAFIKRRIEDWPSLRSRLRSPRSVMCLGNGPSSEDPRLEGLAHDCLIRINWRWRDRGFLTRPDIVFVGAAATVHKVPPCIFGFWSIRIEYEMLLRHLITRGLGRLEYFTMMRLSPIIRDREWPARPSNGALSVVAAAALQPERLIIAGMDLFLHPNGRYPGDVLARNDYSQAHARDTELAIINLALRDFGGEVVILSDILRDALERFREGARDRP